MFRYLLQIRANPNRSLTFFFAIETNWSIFLRRFTPIVNFLLSNLNRCWFLFFSISGTDDEQFNDEKAYLIKQISELKDTKGWRLMICVPFLLSLFFRVCVFVCKFSLDWNSFFLFSSSNLLLIRNTYTFSSLLTSSSFFSCPLNKEFCEWPSFNVDRHCLLSFIDDL